GRELLDRVAAVQQLALVAVDVGDGGLAGGGGEETRVVREHPGLCVQLADVDDFRADAALVHGQFDAGAAVGERQGGFGVGEFHDVFTKRFAPVRGDALSASQHPQHYSYVGPVHVNFRLLACQQEVQQVVVVQLHQ